MGQANRDLQPAFRLWLEGKTNQVVFDQVDAMLLRRINENGSLSAAAKIVGLSYRAAWGRIKRLENALGRPLVVKRVGG
ncbi:MAG: LysR family transcriptional regulator, partial [Thermoprotei archaeon]